MSRQIHQRVAAFPWYLGLLPAFWAFHGYVQHFPLVQPAEALSWGGFYLGLALVLAGLGWLYLRDFGKSALWAGLLLLAELFFGPFHDFLKSFSASIFLVKYSFLLPAGLALLVFGSWKLKKSARPLNRMAAYLNLVFLVLVFIEGLRLFAPMRKAEKPVTGYQETIPPFITTDKPDVYLIVADGYPGHVQLATSLGYDNRRFEEALQLRGFLITDSSRANYNFTQFSMASLLNMAYLQDIRGVNSDKRDIQRNYQAIRESRVLRFFQSQGYRFYNASVFDFPDQPSLARTSFLFRREKALRVTTLSYRLRRDLAYHLLTTLKLPGVIRAWRMNDLHNNERLGLQTLSALHDTSKAPKLVYTHLNLPHYPYYFDSTGKTIPYDVLTDNYGKDTSAFLSYLKYSNGQLLDLIDTIKKQSRQPPVILLISDHGFREYPYPVDPAITFYNLMALHIPGAEKSDWPAGMTNVNLFRTLLRTKWGLPLPNLPDSTFVIRD